MAKKEEPKTKAEIIGRILNENKENLFVAELMEKYYTRKVIVGDNKQHWELLLGQCQTQLKETKSIIAFLEEVAKDYKYL